MTSDRRHKIMTLHGYLLSHVDGNNDTNAGVLPHLKLKCYETFGFSRKGGVVRKTAKLTGRSQKIVDGECVGTTL